MIIIATFIISVISLVSSAGIESEVANLQSLYSSLQDKFTNHLNEVEQLKTDLECDFFISSCSSLAPSCSSGYYVCLTGNGSAVRVYCDTTLLCGDITGG